MAVRAVQVREKSVPQRSRRGVLPWLMAVLAVFGGVLGTLGYDHYSGNLGLIGPQYDVESAGQQRIIKVPPGGNLQGAINAAESGDIIELQAGAVYAGQINLPNKTHTDFVTIRSSRFADLPADQRVSPSQRSSMAMITAGMLGRAAVATANGAHHYRFIGIEFTTTSTAYNYGLVRFGNGEKRPELVAHTLEIDRSYIHSNPKGTTRRGIAVNSADTTIKNSYIEGFAYPGEETQGICGWAGTRNVRIINNYVEGGAENIMFGGADPNNAELIPSDIEVRGNHLNKPREWVGKATLKAFFQLKNAKRVRFTDNLITNNWEGTAFRITVRNQDGGAPFSTIEDVVIKDNIVQGGADGLNILGRDDTNASQTLKGLVIENNLFLNSFGEKALDGIGYFIQIAGGEDISVINNTVFNKGNIVTFYGRQPQNFTFRDNIVGHGDYGIHGLPDLRVSTGRAMFQNNVIMNLNGISSSDHAFPPGNEFVNVARDVGFLDIGAGDFRLAPQSKFRGKGSGGRDLGSQLIAAPQRTALSPNPTP